MADSHRHASGNSDAETISKAILMATKGLKLQPANSEATSFLGGLNGSVHKALDLSAASGLEVEIRHTHHSLKLTFDSDREHERIDLDELYQECRESQQELVVVQKTLLKDSKISKELGDIVFNFEEDEVHYENFQDVGQVVDAAYGLIDKKLNTAKPEPEGSFHKLAASIRKGFHGFCRNAKNIEPFLEFIPDASGYGSVLVGALSIILKVAAAYESLDTLIHTALNDIRRITDSPTNQILKALSNDASLHEKMSALYAKIFGVLRLVTERVFARAKRWNKFKRGVTHLADNEDELSTLRLEMLQRAEDVRHLVQTLGVIKLDRIEKKVGALLDLDLQERLERGNALVQLYGLLTASMEMNKHMSRQITAQKKKRRALAPAPPPLPEVDVDDLLESKCFPRTMIEDDCLELSNSRNLLGGGRDYQKMRYLSDHNRLQAFVTLDTSMVLMVNGGVGSRDDQLSPVSYVVAKLVTTLRTVQQQSPFIISVAFFCGQHQHDRYSGCRELMITLILQLIDQYRAFSAEVLNECNCYLEESDLSGLCDLYEKLCYELPEGMMLYCTLDGLSSFSFPDKRLEEMQIAIGRLLALARGISEKPRACIKLLCATPAICPGVEAVFESWDILDLDDRSTSSVIGCVDWEDGVIAASTMS
ncbi:hypothetical protein PG996_006412 [Apiospora saccharicola]|uniref:Fungal STAND N-terminal Goodbye domain-containing protein n=1 Tax=Apiospora saccharicola TaxID=335842 RepID=A0ABR1VP87_9PEZI